jgi:predicted RNA-binding Zn ribbon-like protein
MAANRAPAPEPLRLIQGFLNTHDIATGADAIRDAGGWRGWLVEHGLVGESAPVHAAEAQRAMALREALRELAEANSARRVAAAAVERLNETAGRCRLVARFDAQGRGRLAAEDAGAAGALGRLLAVVLTAMADGSWERLKICREDTCRRAFYDRSRNRSGAWCSMAVCGNRAKARLFRSRQDGGRVRR